MTVWGQKIKRVGGGGRVSRRFFVGCVLMSNYRTKGTGHLSIGLDNIKCHPSFCNKSVLSSDILILFFYFLFIP